jgi:hypothetical protein
VLQCCCTEWDDWAPLNWHWPPAAGVFPDGAGHWLGTDPYMPSRPFPLSLYNGLWNGGASFGNMGSKYKWSGVGESVCVDPQFFEDVFKNGSKAGMVMMEQDYLCSSTAQTARDLSVGPTWFAAMDAAAQQASVDMQLCMMNPGHALASTLLHAASNGRGTGDHVVRNAARGLPLGWSGMLLWSLGVWPSRDNVWTNSSVNVTGLPNPETAPDLQTAMAVLGGGPYGPADIAGAMNQSLIMRSCRSDGVLLRPSWPATAVDASFAHSFDSLKPLYIWTALSIIGSQQYCYVLSINLDAPLALTVAEMCGGGSAVASEVVVHEAWHGLDPSGGSGGSGSASSGSSSGSEGGVQRLRSSEVFTLPATPQISEITAGHSLWVVAPVLAGNWSFLGEPDKIVKASERRVASLGVSADGATLTAEMLLAPAEEIVVAVLSPTGDVLRTQCSAKGQGAVVAYGDRDVAMALTCSGRTCACKPAVATE